MHLFRTVLLALLLSMSAVAQAGGFDHAPWDRLLRQHVSMLPDAHASSVDYAGLLGQRAALKRYLDATAAVTRAQFEQFDRSGQLAFLINVYNAQTVALILTAYPDIASIKELGSLFQSPWKKRFFQLLGQARSLDELEHQLIRGSGRYNEPRIHFAVNCASIGCPALRAEAYVGARLEAQLEDATLAFLSDRSRNRRAGDALQVSSIFKWYRDDFQSGWRGHASLGSFLAGYRGALGLDAPAARRLAAGTMDIDFLDYDWRLNGASAVQ